MYRASNCFVKKFQIYSEYNSPEWEIEIEKYVSKMIDHILNKNFCVQSVSISIIDKTSVLINILY